MKLKLKIPQEINYLELGVNTLNFLILVTLGIGVWSIGAVSAQLDFWLTLMVILAIFRLFLSFFFGLDVWKQAQLDLPLLTFLTGIIIISILNSGEAGPTSLGGTNIWGIGVLMLTSLSIYLIHILTRKTQFEKYLLGFIVTGMTFPILSATLTGFADPKLVGLAISQLLLIWVTSTKFKNKFMDIFLGVIAINSIYTVLRNFQNDLMALVTFSIIATATFGFFLSQKKGKISINVEELTKSPKFVLTFISVITFIIIQIVMVTNGAFTDNFQVITSAYSNYINGISSPTEFFLGNGLTPGKVAVVSFVQSYGILAVLFIAYPVSIIFKTIYSELKQKLSLERFMILILNIFFIFRLFIGSLDLHEIIIYVFVLVLLFNNSTPFEKEEVSKYSLVSFDRFKNKNLRYFLQSIRIVIAALLIAYAPMIIGIVTSIF